MAAAKKIRQYTNNTYMENYIPSTYSKTPEYFKYYIVRIREFLDSESESFYYHLKKFLNEDTNQGEILNFLIMSFEKSGVIIKDERFEKNVDRLNYMSRVYSKYHLEFGKDLDYITFNTMIYDKFYELLYKSGKSFQEEVVFVILINTLEFYGYLKITDSSEEIADVEMFKFS